MPETETVIRKLTCNRCGASWFPLKPHRPQTCAKCRSLYWDKPRQRQRPAREGRRG